ncbi:MAG: DUF4142 domain-containing protein [Rhodospirillaceae bacterium]
MTQDTKKSRSSSAAVASFIGDAMIGNLYEVEASRLALQRAKSDQVRTFAAMMLDDHLTAGHQLQSTLRSMPNIAKVPSELDDKHGKMIDTLRNATDDDFDGQYLKQQAKAHKENLTLFRSFADSGDNPILRTFATATLPSLERHLDMVKAVK